MPVAHATLTFFHKHPTKVSLLSPSDNYNNAQLVGQNSILKRNKMEKVLLQVLYVQRSISCSVNQVYLIVH